MSVPDPETRPPSASGAAGEETPGGGSRLKLFLKVFASLGVGLLCSYLVVRKMDRGAVGTAFARVSLSAALGYLGTMVVTHYFRAVRWAHLLAPIGVVLPRGRLLSSSSVGFMAILALPFRLGEFVRPYYVVRSGRSRMSAVLGTVAVERVVDGLLISLLLVTTYALSPDAFARPIEVLGGLPLKYFAWLSLTLFVSATLFLVAALIWKDATVRWLPRLMLLTWVAPRLAAKLRDRLSALIEGLAGLRSTAHMVPFLFESVLYWGANGFGMWLLARGMGLPVSLTACYAAMAFTGVVISLPNSPGLVGQFQLGVVAVMSAFMGSEAGGSAGLAYALVLHALQAAWYLGVGLLCLRYANRGIAAGRLGEVVAASNRAVAEASNV